MRIHSYEYRKRQYDGKIAVWASVDDPFLTKDDQQYVYPNPDNPTFKTAVKRWICMFVGDSEEDGYNFIMKREAVDTPVMVH